MSLRELEQRLERYHLCANACAPGIYRTAYMLGMMVCVAAACGEILTMPPDWGWPPAPAGADGPA